jgi:hypothetical protein
VRVQPDFHSAATNAQIRYTHMDDREKRSMNRTRIGGRNRDLGDFYPNLECDVIGVSYLSRVMITNQRSESCLGELGARQVDIMSVIVSGLLARTKNRHMPRALRVPGFEYRPDSVGDIRARVFCGSCSCSA